jgi:hypothetical protein
MKNKNWFMAAAAILPVLLGLLAGCKTTVPVSYTVPARLDLSGVNRVAVDSDDSRIVNSISQDLSGTGKYTAASAAELSAWKQWKAERQAMEELSDYQGQAIAVSSADLVRAYSGNAVRADASYLDKALKISAVVKEIGKSSRGSYFVRLEGAGNDSVDVFFVPSEINAVAAVDKGQTITIFGKCRGYNPPNMEDTGEILRILGAGRSVNIIDATFPVGEMKDYPGAVDAVITLNASSSVEDSSHTDKRAAVDSNGYIVKDAEGNTVYENITIYERRAVVDMNYRVERARDGSLIGQGTESGITADSNEDRSKLPSPAELAASSIYKALSGFTGEIVPTQSSTSITLAKESENKEAKKEMRAAEKLVKGKMGFPFPGRSNSMQTSAAENAKNYADAAAAYGKIYAKYKNFAAGYNQAVLTEAAAGTEAAIGLMEALAKETGNPAAQRALTDMQSRNAGNQRAAAQLSQ